MSDSQQGAGAALNQMGASIVSASIEEQALQWFTRMQSGECSAQDTAEHKSWLDANLMHQKAYRELAALWGLVGDFANTPGVRAACQQAMQSPVLAMPLPTTVPPAPQEQEVHHSSRQHHWLPFALAACLLLVVIGVGIQEPGVGYEPAGVYQTNAGQQKTVMLDDGSVLMLDTQTRLTTDFSSQRRRIVLEQGQARFDVAHDKNRPFVVEAGNGTVTALGTVFVVRKNEDAVLVTLIEGSVAVAQEEPVTAVTTTRTTRTTGATAAKTTATAITATTTGVALTRKLIPGQQLAYSDLQIEEAASADLVQATAWQQERLVFQDRSLTDVIADLNRYSTKKILLGDDALASIRITGVFKVGDNRKAIHTLQAYFSMQVTTDLHGNLVLLPEGQNPSA